METKKSEPHAHGEEQDKRTFDFTALLLLSLKKRLYDRLKQGCFRLAYRPNKDLVLTKHPARCKDDGEVSYCAELSETSTLTDRTNSVRSDVFYLCDGQWRSGDWSTVGATTMTKRQNSTTMTRRRQVHVRVLPAEELDPDFEERVTSVSEINTIQTFLPWFLPWILTVLTIMLSRSPSHSHVAKRRRDQNLRKVRSCLHKASRRSAKNVGVKPILQTRSSSTLLLARSLPTQNKEPSKDSPRSRKITRQCAAVARVNRQPANGLPPRPRMIMTPPASPRASPSESRGNSLKSLCGASSSVPLPIENSPRAEIPQPIKVLSESPKKLIIEIEKAGQLEGLLSKHFAQQGIDQSEGRSTTNPVSQETDTNRGSCRTNIPETLVKCSGRSLEDTAAEMSGSQEKLLGNSFKSTQSRKAEAIRMIQAKKKSRNRESAHSKDSLNSAGTATSDEQLPRGRLSRETSGVEPAQNSLPSSYGPEFYLDRQDSNSGSGTLMLDSATSMGSESSTFAVDLEGAPLSSQICELVRRNSTILGKDPIDVYMNSPMNPWSSIDEETSQDLKLDSGTESIKSGAQEERRVDSPKAATPTQMEKGTPVVKASIRRNISPFSDASLQKMSPPSPQRRQSSTASEGAEMNSSSARKSVVKESVTKPMSRVTKPPPPPPKKKTETPETKAKSKPAPPTRGNVKEKKASTAAPPPPPGHKKKNGKNGSGYVRSSEVIRVFQDMRKISKKPYQPRVKSQKSSGSDASNLASQGSGGDALIKELEKNSSYFAQIQSDIETHGPAINKMIQEINSRKFESMSEMNAFVKGIDDVLETFADETAVLKQFEWPQKYYVYREALALWSELKNRTEKCYKWTSGSRGISAELNRMKKTMELNLRRLDEIQRTLETDVKKFTRNGIPWDSAVLQKVNDGTMSLLEKYMKIVYDEVDRTQTKQKHRDKNLSLLTETVNLTFKIHQFVGGLTESCTSLFEQIASFTRTLNDL